MHFSPVLGFECGRAPAPLPPPPALTPQLQTLKLGDKRHMRVPSGVQLAASKA